MKPIYYILACCLLVFSSCGKMDSLSQFSKRKYLQKSPNQKVKEQEYAQNEPIHEMYASAEMQPSEFMLEEIPELDDGELVFQKENKAISSPILKETPNYIPERKKFNLFTLSGATLYSGLIASVYLIDVVGVMSNPITATMRIIGISVALVGFILVTIGFVKSRKKPDKYKGRKLSFWLFLGSIIAVLAFSSVMLFWMITLGTI